MYLWKTIKVFISSTFLDMEWERDKLAEVFLPLKQKLAQRRIALIPYDLRWREKHSNKSLVKWCLEMVRQCDYFIGILGFRYGWRPEFDETGRANDKRISITEMEIREALKNLPQENRFFFMGDNSLRKEENLSMQTSEDSQDQEKLKSFIREKEERIYGYKTTAELSQILLDKLQRSIDEEYPGENLVDLEEYTRQQALKEILEEKVRGFVGRDDSLKEIERFVSEESSKNYLAILGVAGTGKSALLASFIKNWKENHKEVPLVIHFMSMGSDSRNIQGIMLHLGEQLQDIGILQQELKEDPAELRSQIRLTLEGYKGKLILAIDGLDEIEDLGKDMAWLSRNIPSNIKILLTIRPVEPWEQLQKWENLTIFSLPPLSEVEIFAIIEDYNRNHTLKMSHEDKVFLAQRADGNPLYLKVALEEMISSGIAVGQLATSIESLFEQILQRLQKKYGVKMMEDYFGLIAASRNGLAEMELQELLSQEEFSKASQNIVDEALLSTTKACENFIVRRGGLLQFFHPEFERSLKERLGKSGMRTYHKRLACYFFQKGWQYERSLLETCYQYQWAEEYHELLKTLSDFSFLQAKVKAGMPDDLLQDFIRALDDTVVGVPFSFSISKAQDVLIDRNILKLLAKAIKVDLNFLRQRPESLFGTLWNRCYWYDAPEAEDHYLLGHEEISLPWREPGSKLYKLMEFWRKDYEQTGFLWLQSLKPMELSLGSPLLKILRKHEGWITGLAFHPEGNLLVSCSHDKILCLWDMGTGECIKTFQGHEGKITSLAFFPDGKRVCSADESGQIRIWSIENASCLQSWKAHDKSIEGIALDRQGRCLATASKDYSIKVWDVQTAANLATLYGHLNEVISVAFSPDGSKLVSGSADQSIKIWDIATGTCQKTIAHHKRLVYQVLFSPDGTQIASGSRDDTACLWDASTGENIHTLCKHQWGVLGIAYSPDGKKLATASGDKSIALWDTQTGKCLKTFRWHERSVCTVCFSPDGTYLVSGAYDKTIRIWDATSTECSLVLKGHDEWARVAAFSNSGKLYASGSTDKKICLWDAMNGHLLRQWKAHEGWITALCFHKNDRILASGGGDGYIKLWDVSNAVCLKSFAAHTEAVMDILFLDTKDILVSVSRDKTMKLWNIETGECIKTFTGHDGWISCVDYCPEKDTLLTGSHDTSVCLWDRQAGNCLKTIGEKQSAEHKPDHHIRSVAFTKEGDKIVSCNRGQRGFVWDIATMRCMDTLWGELDAREMASSKSRFYINVQDTQSHLIDKTTGDTLSIFPETILSAKVSSLNTITGVSQGPYVYLLALKGY